MDIIKNGVTGLSVLVRVERAVLVELDFVWNPFMEDVPVRVLVLHKSPMNAVKVSLQNVRFVQTLFLDSSILGACRATQAYVVTSLVSHQFAKVEKYYIDCSAAGLGHCTRTRYVY